MVLTYAALQGSIAALAAALSAAGTIDGYQFAEGLRDMAANLPPVAKQAIEDIVGHMAALGHASDRPALRLVD
jgi:hypothetical protein